MFFDPRIQSVADCCAMLQQAPKFDVLFGVRNFKRQNLYQNLFSRGFYAFVKLFGGGKIHTKYSDCICLNRKAIHFLLKQDQSINLLRLTQFDEAFSIGQYHFTPIAKDKPKKFIDSLNIGIDIVFQNSYKLLRLGTITSIAMAFGNVLYGLYILYTFVCNPHRQSGWASSSLYMVVMFSALFLILAIFGEYMRVILLHFKRKDTYELIDETSTLTLATEQKNIKDS